MDICFYPYKYLFQIEKKIYAKAKKLVEKAEKKKLKKIKELMAQEKKEVRIPKDIMNEFSLKDDNEIGDLENNIHIDSSKKNKKRKKKDKKSKTKSKKRKHSQNESSSSTSSDSEHFANVESRAKRSRDISDESHEYFIDPKKKKNSSILENSSSNMFDMNTLLNIKNEKNSDEEDAICKNKSKESENKNKSPYKQQIINACELQSSFLEGNKNSENLSSTIIKTEPCLGRAESNNKNDKLQDRKVSLLDENSSQPLIETIYSEGKNESDPFENNDIPSLKMSIDNVSNNNSINLTIPVVNNGAIKNNDSSNVS